MVNLLTVLPGGVRPEQRPGSTVVFDFENERYLKADQSGGATAYVTDGVPLGGEVPLVIFLHGLNDTGAMRPWMVSTDPRDLRPVSNGMVRAGTVSPHIVAAPTQTKNATVPRILWPNFDLDGFVDAVDMALAGRAWVRRDRVVVVGHSGGGCNPRGGIVGVAESRGFVTPHAVLAVDTCLEPEIKAGLLEAAPGTSLWVAWQRITWPRPFEEFRRNFEQGVRAEGLQRRVVDEVTGLGGAPHDAILTHTWRRALPDLLGPDRGLLVR